MKRKTKRRYETFEEKLERLTRPQKVNLSNWKESRLLDWILDSEKNDLLIRKFILEFWLWKHRNRKKNYSVTYSKGKKGEHTVICNNGEDLDFWLPIFKERGLLK
jgi:hypothetical protein